MKKSLFYVINIHDFSPEDIHWCYEQRCDMEILNRDLKSNLKIDHFMGRNLNAVLIQVSTDSLPADGSLQDLPQLSSLSGEIKRALRYCSYQSLQKVRRA